MSNTITMMTVTDIMRKATRSLDLGFIDWWQVLAAKVSHSHFDNLTDAIMENGFTLPIVLVGNDDDGYTIGNGHHRLCAAILLGLTSIPVTITDGDYWAFEDSHDGEWNPGDRSFEYWGMLTENMPDGYSGDKWNEVHRDQFGNRDDAPDEYGDDNACYNCGGCGTCCGGECMHDEEECGYCGVTGDDLPYDDHKMGCPEREYETMWCGWHGFAHYRYNACTVMRNGMHDDAMSEHKVRGYLPNGAWHPVAILVDAYEEEARYEENRALRAAEQEWRVAVANLRDALDNGAGDWRITDHAKIIAERFARYMAL